MMKKQMMSATVQNKEPESVEQLESRIVEVGQILGEQMVVVDRCNDTAVRLSHICRKPLDRNGSLYFG